MSLFSRLREKHTMKFATATHATFATQALEGERTVADVATVAVAILPRVIAEPVPMADFGSDETPILSCWWRVHYVDRDPVEVTCCPEATLSDILDLRPDAIAAEPFIPIIVEPSAPTEEELQTTEARADPDDDRRTCSQCANLIVRRCLAARRGEIIASSNYEPIRDLLRRCEGYVPRADDPDRRHGRERWPALLRKEDE